jgi:signal peptidase I
MAIESHGPSLPAAIDPLWAARRGRKGRLFGSLTVRALLACTVVGAIAIGWFTLAPTVIGGPTSYVVVEGTSMLPHFRADGLVLTRSAPSYHVGEVVAYHNHELHAVVMHRIVARDGNRYVFEGDNNNFRDRYHPTKGDLVGQEWVYWPGAGEYLKAVRSPVTFGVIMAILALIASTAFTPTSKRKRRRHHAR